MSDSTTIKYRHVYEFILEHEGEDTADQYKILLEASSWKEGGLEHECNHDVQSSITNSFDWGDDEINGAEFWSDLGNKYSYTKFRGGKFIDSTPPRKTAREVMDFIQEHLGEVTAQNYFVNYCNEKGEDSLDRKLEDSYKASLNNSFTFSATNEKEPYWGSVRREIRRIENDL